MDRILTTPPQHKLTVAPASGSTLFVNAPEDLVENPRRRALILSAMCIALVAVIASVSSLNVALQALAADLGASQSELLWMVNGYTLALAALLLPVGAIGDRWGRKPVLLAGLVLFSVANVVSALAATAGLLIAMRVVAGVGAAMIMPVTLSVITTSFPIEERGRAVGIWAGFAGAGGIIGLVASAAIIDNATWPWIFAVPVVLAAVSFALTTAVVPHSREHVSEGFDIVGSLVSVLAVGGLVLGLHEGPERGWTDPITIAALVTSIVGLVAFIVVEMRLDHPLLDVRLFRIRRLATGSLNLLVVFGVIFSLFLILVQYLQAVLGYTALTASAGLLPLALMMMPLSVLAPSVAERWGLRPTLMFAMLLLGAGVVLLATMADPDGGYLSVLPGILALGGGVGMAMSPSTAAITSSLPEEKQGVASALNDTVRELGAAIGIALSGSILNATYRSSVEDATATLPPELAEPINDGIGGAVAVTSQMGADGADLLNAARQAFVDGMRPALLVAAGVAVLTAIYTIVFGPDHQTVAAEGQEQLSPQDHPG